MNRSRPGCSIRTTLMRAIITEPASPSAGGRRDRGSGPLDPAAELMGAIALRSIV